MKAILRICSVLLLVLVTVQCDVKNETPVPQNIEPNIESTGRVDYVNIIKPYVYKDNVYFIDLGKTGKMTFINDHEVVFSGDFTITTGNKKLRIAADEPLADGALVYVIKDSKNLTIALELEQGSKLDASFKYEFSVADQNKGVLSAKTAHKETFEFDLKSSIVLQDLLKDTEYENKGNIYISLTPGFKIKYTTETIEEIVDGKIISGTKTETMNQSGNLGTVLRGKFDAEIRGKEFFKIPFSKRPIIFGSLNVPGTPIFVQPAIIMGFGFKGEAELSGGINVFEGNKTKITKLKFEGDKYIEIPGQNLREPDTDLKVFSKIENPVISNLASETKFGIFATVKTYINRLDIPFSDGSFAAASLGITSFFHANFGFNPLATECDDKFTVSPGVEFSYEYGIGEWIQNRKIQYLVHHESILDNFKVGFTYSLSQLVCGPIEENSSILTKFSFEDFKKFVKEKNFELFQGQLPENINGSYAFNPNILGASNFEQDGVPTIENIVTDNRVKPFGKVIIDINDNGKSLSLYQYDLISGKLIAQESSFFENKDILGIKPVVYISQNGFSILCAINGEALTSGEKIEYIDFLALTYFKNNSKASGILKYRVQNIKGQFQKLPVDIYRVFVSNTVTKSNI